MMGGLDTPTSGRVFVREDELAKKDDEELTIFRRRNIGFIFQNYLIEQLGRLFLFGRSFYFYQIL